MATYHPYHTMIVSQYTVVDYIKGPVVKVNGALIEKNPIWVINIDGKERLLMYIEDGVLCELCRESYRRIIDFENKYKSGKKLLWTQKDERRHYVRTNYNNTTLYIHQLIMDWFGHGSGTGEYSVDHIDRNPLNNTLENLRIATSREQHQNVKGVLPDTKKEPCNRAKTLPDEIKDVTIPSYIKYNLNTYGENHEHSREYFRIESHPLLSGGATWVSSTKQSVPIRDKLQQALDALDHINKNGTLPPKIVRELPQYVTYYIERGEHLLVWQKNEGETRLSKKMNIGQNYYDMSKEEQERVLDELNRAIVKKYDNKYQIYKLDESILNEIQRQKEEALPSYVRTQDFADGTYLVFNKNKGDSRITLTQKLPANYNMGKELHIFSHKIVEKYGPEHAIELERFPYDPRSDVIDIPEDVFIVLKCKRPYMFIRRDSCTYTHILPERYNLSEQIEILQRLPDIQSPDEDYTIEQHKQRFADGMKPENISIVFKDKRYYQLQYKVKTKEHRHDKTMFLPKVPAFNLNLELVKLNETIIRVYGKEFSVLLCK
jgi:hypothetical protein